MFFAEQATPGTQSALVAIQPGGSKPPLFLVHPAGGHVFPYIHLAQFSAPINPAMGCRPKAWKTDKTPHTRIEDMAAYYIQAMQTVQPTGPYLLGGWSMGGVVAFEMAQQLHAQGQPVALLAMLDGRIPTPDDDVSGAGRRSDLVGRTLFWHFVWPDGVPDGASRRRTVGRSCWKKRRAPAWCPRSLMFPRLAGLSCSSGTTCAQRRPTDCIATPVE